MPGGIILLSGFLLTLFLFTFPLIPTIDDSALNEVVYLVELPLVRDEIHSFVQIQEEVMEGAIDLHDLVFIVIHVPDGRAISREDRVPVPAAAVLPDFIQTRSDVD